VIDQLWRSVMTTVMDIKKVKAAYIIRPGVLGRAKAYSTEN
jgi:hypothetical protein